MKLGSAAGRFALVAGCCLGAGALPAAAEVIDAEVSFGGRAISGDTNSGKFEEYRDLEPGAFGSTNFLVESPNGATYLWGDFDHIGYQDQSYSIEAGQWGRLRLFGEYSELPHIFSNQTRSLYHYSGSDLLTLPPGDQAAVQAAIGNAAKSAVLGTQLGAARQVSLDYQLRTIVGGLIFDPREDLELETAYRQLERSGQRPLSMLFGGFGGLGGNFTSFAGPIDEQTNEVTGTARWGRGPFHLDVGYLGSFFDNDLDQVTVANPLLATDAPGGASQGSLSLAPDNSLNQFHATGTYDLPLEFPARLATTFSYGLRRQDDDFLPHTINPTIAGNPLLALPQNSLDGKVQTYLANVLVTARPLPDLDLRGRYRFYDLHNDTPVLDFPGLTENDQGVEVEEIRNPVYGYQRQEAGLDAAYRISEAIRIRGGPFWDQWSRSQAREVSRLNEYGAKLSADVKPTSWSLVRLDYLFGTRNGTAYNPYNYLFAFHGHADAEEAEAGEATGQLSSLRKFDEADRTRNEVKLLTQLMPREDLDWSFSGGWANYDYRNSSYGTKGDQRWNLGSEIGYQPLEWLSISAWYSFEHMQLDQRSRYRAVSGGVTIDDPANDWSSESTDIYHTLGARLGFVLVPEKLDLDFSYIFEHGTGETHSSSAAGCAPLPGCTTSDGGNAPNFPDMKDRLQLFATTLTYHWDEHFSVQGMYAFQKLSTQDYRLDGLNPYMADSNVNGSGVISPSLDVFLGNRQGDYAANIFALSATYRF